MPELDGAVLEPEVDVTADDGAEVEAEPLESEPEIESTEPAESEELEPEEPETESEAEQVTADGRKMPDSLKKAIAGIKATNPEAAKLIKGMFFADQEYRSVFPKPADAVAAKTLIEQVGGPEGLQQIESERQEWTALDQKFEEGSGDFVKSIAEANPDAFVKIAPHAINEWANRAPEQYGYYANTVALNTLKQAGIDLPALASAYKGYANNPEAQAIIAEVHNALLGLKEKTTQFEQKRTDPREEQLKQKETAFEQKRRADFESDVESKAEPLIAELMKPEMERVISGRAVDPDAMKAYEKMIRSRAEEMIAANPNFTGIYEAHLRSGDKAKAVAYVQQEFRRVMPEAVKVIAPFLRNIQAAPKRAAAPTNGTRTASPGEVVLKEMPDWNDVDRSKTTVADMMMGKAVLRNGKKATGWA